MNLTWEGGGLVAIVSMKQLEVGDHFGHQTRRWNPKMKEYIFTERNGIYIIDLQKTKVPLIDVAYNFIKEVVANGESVLLWVRKSRAYEAIREEAQRCGMFYGTSGGSAAC